MTEGTMDVIPFLGIKFITGDVIAIVVAIIAFGGVIISTIYTNGTTKKISKSNEQQQYELNQKNIDANLIANARIEWIQNVRETTSELLALLFEVLNTTDKSYLLEPVLKAQEKIELLILYFGHENTENKFNDDVFYNKAEKIDSKSKDDILYKTSDNSNKNILIVEFLSELSTKLYNFYKKALSNELIDLKNSRDKRLDRLQDYVLYEEKYEVEDDEGNRRIVSDSILDEEYEKKLDDIANKIEIIEDIPVDINKDLLKLRDIMRIYLKNEWNVAKKAE